MKYIKSSLSLFENQEYNVNQLSHKRRALLCDKCGNGKTVSVLYAFAQLKESGKLNNLLVLTPRSAYDKGVWKKDISSFTNFKCIDLEVLLEKIHNFPHNLEKYLTHYDIVYGKHSHVSNVDYMALIKAISTKGKNLVVLDEVHAYKNPKSSLTVSTKIALMGTYALWGLTATPLSKNLEDTYNIINFVYPGYLGTFLTFRNQYCSVERKVIGRFSNGSLKKVDVITGIKDEDEFNNKIAPIVIRGKSTFRPNIQYIDYTLSPSEAHIYRKVAAGLDFDSDSTSEEWITKLMSDDVQVDNHPIKNVEKFSSRFLYLQTAADGVLTNSGLQNNIKSSKIDKLLEKLKEIVGKKQSCLVYFDYYASVDAIQRAIVEAKIPATILQSTGKNVLSDEDVTEAKCKVRPHIILCTKASSESASYYFINNVIFFHIPTVVSTVAQMAGRILRKNTIYPNDLNLFYFRSPNIDLYKLELVSIKSYQMEITAGEECSIPKDYKMLATKSSILDKQKKLLLWNLT